MVSHWSVLDPGILFGCGCDNDRLSISISEAIVHLRVQPLVLVGGAGGKCVTGTGVTTTEGK